MSGNLRPGGTRALGTLCRRCAHHRRCCHSIMRLLFCGYGDNGVRDGRRFRCCCRRMTRGEIGRINNRGDHQRKKECDGNGDDHERYLLPASLARPPAWPLWLPHRWQCLARRRLRLTRGRVGRLQGILRLLRLLSHVCSFSLWSKADYPMIFKKTASQ